MAFTLPNFNLQAAVYSGPYLDRGLHRFIAYCNLAHGRRVYQNPQGEDPGQFVATMTTYLLFPVGTDVRDLSCGTGASDVIECPVSSGRWYGVESVDDAGKGFANEHRVVCVTKIFEELNVTEYAGLHWPVPIP